MKKQIALATLIYTALATLQPLSNFILIPVYTNYLSVEDYATFSILNNLSAFFAIISGLNIVNATMAFYTSFKDDKQGLNIYISNVMTFTLYFSIIFLILMLVLGDTFFKIIFKSPIPFYPSGFLCVFYGLIMNVSTGYLFFLKYEKMVWRYAIISVALFIINTISQYYFIAVLKMGSEGAWIARCLTASMAILIVTFYHFKYFSFKLDYKKYIKPSLKYAVPMIPAAFLGWVTTYGDRFIIERFVNLRSLGIYSFLLTISSLTEMIYLAFGAALQPFIFDFYVEENKKKVHMLYRFFVMITVCFGSALVLIGSNMDIIIKKQVFLEAMPYLAVMTVGYAAAGVSYLFNLQIIYKQKSKYFLHQSAFILPFNIILNLILIQLMDVWGAVLATVLTKIVMAICSRHYAEKSIKINPGWSLLLPLGIFSLLTVIFLIAGLNGYIPFKISSVIQFLIIITLVFLGYKNEIRMISSQFMQKYKA